MKDKTMMIFIGGDPATVRACWPIFEVLGDASCLIYYGGRRDRVR